MSSITILAGIVISVLLFMWLVKVIKATLQTALIVAVLLFAFNFFGIGPGNLVQSLLQWLGETIGIVIKLNS
jgi:hypothetical protein